MRFSFLRLAYAFLVVLFLLLCSSVILPQSYQPPTEKYVDAALSSLPDLPNWVPWDDVESTRDVNRGRAVREAFLHTWKGYMEHAFPHDMLRPLTNKYEDDRSGWGCTAVDTLTAAILLEVPEIIKTALFHIEKIDWDKVTSPKVAIFGSTIRYLGAMVSAYDLLTNTHTHLAINLSSTAIDALLTQSQSLADSLSVSFSTPSGIFHNQLLFPQHSITPGHTNDITAISGLPLEWTHLSDLTQNSTYANLSLKAMEPLLNPKPEHPSPFPGLLPRHINTDTGRLNTSDSGGWSHAGGGLYEMLLKLSVYDPVRFASYRDHWKLAANSTMAYLASHPRGRPDLTFLADFNETELIYRADHSGMFAAASFILGGAVTGEKRYLDFGLDLVRTYVELYRSTATGLGPESWGWVPGSCQEESHGNDEKIGREIESEEEKAIADISSNTKVAKRDQTRDECIIPEVYASKTSTGFTDRTGYFMTETAFKLRPEVLESLYYAYRVTGDEIYRDWSWEIFLRINETCRTGSAFAELKDVNVMPEGGSKNGRHDRMYSFVLSEVFMYAYIIHAEDAPWHVKNNDMNEWVFSTEGHPMKVVSQRRPQEAQS